MNFVSTEGNSNNVTLRDNNYLTTYNDDYSGKEISVCFTNGNSIDYTHAYGMKLKQDKEGVEKSIKTYKLSY